MNETVFLSFVVQNNELLIKQIHFNFPNLSKIEISKYDKFGKIKNNFLKKYFCVF